MEGPRLGVVTTQREVRCSCAYSVIAVVEHGCHGSSFVSAVRGLSSTPLLLRSLLMRQIVSPLCSQVRRWLDQSIGACEKIKAPPDGVPTSLLPSVADLFLPHKYSTQKLPQALHGLLPDDDSAPSPPELDRPAAADGKHVTWGGVTRVTRKRGLSSTPGDEPPESPHEHHRKTPRLLSAYDDAHQSQGSSRVREAAGGAPLLVPLLVPAKLIGAHLSGGLSACKAAPKKEYLRQRFCEECRGRGGASELLVCSEPECTTAWHRGCLPELLEKPPLGPWKCPCCTEFGRPITDVSCYAPVSGGVSLQLLPSITLSLPSRSLPPSAMPLLLPKGKA